MGEVGGTQQDFTAASGAGAEHGSFAEGTGIGVGECDAQVERVRADGEKWIGPGGGLVHIDIHAFGGQGDEGECGALGIAKVGGGLSSGLGLAPCVDGVLSDTDDGLLFAMAGDERDGQKQGHGGKSFES
jgi:hypothetical protein